MGLIFREIMRMLFGEKMLFKENKEFNKAQAKLMFEALYKDLKRHSNDGLKSYSYTLSEFLDIMLHNDKMELTPNMGDFLYALKRECKKNGINMFIDGEYYDEKAHYIFKWRNKI